MSLNYNTKKLRKTAARIGSATNYADFDTSGRLTLAGDAERNITIRPDIQYDEINKALKPTLEYYGPHTYYSLPVYDDDNEEIFATINIPRRWDGAVAPRVHLHTCLTGTEVVGHKYKLAVAFSIATPTGSLASPAATTASAETAIVSGKTSAHDCYLTEISLGTGFDWDDTLSLRVRRTAATEATDISSELGLTDFHVDFKRDKLGGDW